MAVGYKAEGTRLDSAVALKFLPDDFALVRLGIAHDSWKLTTAVESDHAAELRWVWVWADRTYDGNSSASLTENLTYEMRIGEKVRLPPPSLNDRRLLKRCESFAGCVGTERCTAAGKDMDNARFVAAERAVARGVHG